MNKYGQRGNWHLTDFGVEVMKKLAERNMKVKDLAEMVGMRSDILSQMLHGERKGTKYIESIREVTGLEDGKKNVG